MAQGCSSVRLPHSVARPHPLAHRDQRGREPPRLFGRLLEQMKGETLGRLAADPRKPGELGDQLLDGAHRQTGGERQRGHLPHLGLQQVGRAPLRLGHRGQHQIAEELGVVALEHGGIDDDRAHRAAAVGRDADHAAARRGLDRAAGELGLQLLQPALHLLAELKELLKICHALG